MKYPNSLQNVDWAAIDRMYARGAKAPARINRRYDKRFRAGDDDPIVRPPDSVTTYDDRGVVLFTADERPLVRRAGF